MIITDNDAKALLKAPGPGPSLHASTSAPPPGPPPPPPAYEPSPSPGPSRPLLPPEIPKNYPRRNLALRRFLKAFLVASIIWLLLTAFVRSIIDLAQHPRRGGDPPYWGQPVNPSHGDGTIVKCKPDWDRPYPFLKNPAEVEGDLVNDQSTLVYESPSAINEAPSPSGPREPQRRKLQFSFPPTSEILYFIARGSHSQGAFHYEASADADQVFIQVVMTYWNSPVRQQVRMCKLEQGDNAIGFGIFTPVDHWHWLPEDHQRIVFDVTVVVPLGDKSFINSLRSSLPNFSQSLGAFADEKYLDLVDLKGTNGGVNAVSLASHNASIQTTNGQISGHYITDNVLSLVTTNGRIHVDVDLINQDKRSDPTQLALITTNGLIESSISTSTVPSDDPVYPGAEGHFAVYAHTTNNRVDLKVPVAPPSSSVQVEGGTTNGVISAHLHRAIEATFSLASTNAAPPRVESHLTYRDDPLNKDRNPNLEISKRVSNSLQGIFWWGSWGRRNSVPGSVALRTTNGAAILSLI